MLTKVENEKYNQHMLNKVKNSPLRGFLKAFEPKVKNVPIK